MHKLHLTDASQPSLDRRFQFGDNWRSFLDCLDGERVTGAEKSLQWLLHRERLDEIRFLDVGSGSGLSSLAARRLGARVVSFDYAPQSVKCTAMLRDRFFQNDPDWRIERGSILDRDYLKELGQFDVVYSWGVLHHTGALHDAIRNAAQKVSLEVRAGLHAGECELTGNDVRGLAVHIGARVASEAGSGEVLVSRTVRDMAVGSELAFAERGAYRLKGVPGEWQLFLAQTVSNLG